MAATNDVRITISTDSASAEQGMSRVRSSLKETETAASSLTSAFASLGGAAGIGLYVQSSIEAALSTERITSAMKAVTDSSTMAGRELQFIREESNRLGLNFVSTADAFAKFTAATRNTSIEGEATRKVFSGVSEAVTALKLSGDQANGIFMALSQMMSKGKVSMEELRGQLGERLPGAFKLAADAMGLTTAELDKQITDGKIMSADLLPKLAEQLHKTYGVAAAESAKGAAAEIERFKNAALESKEALGTSLLPVLTDVLKLFTSGGNLVRDFVGGIQMLTVEVMALAERSASWVKAGGLIGMMFGDNADEHSARLADIAKRVAEQKQEIYDRLQPNVSSQKSAAELAAENASVGMAKEKELADRSKMEAEKLANEKKAYEEQIYKNELQRLQDQGKIKLSMLKYQHESGLVSNRDYYLAVVEEEKKAFDLQIAQAEKHIQNLQSLKGTPGYADSEKSITLEKDIMAAIGQKTHMEMEFQQKRQAATYDAIKTEQTLADQVAKQITHKLKELDHLRLSINASNQEFQDKKDALLNGEQSAAQKLITQKERLKQQEEEYNHISDPEAKKRKLLSLADTWGDMLDKIDTSTMLTSQKMMEINAIEEERSRIQGTVLQTVEDEKQALIETYDTALSKVQEYKNELQLLDELIRSMSRDITVNLRIKTTGSASISSGLTVEDTGDTYIPDVVGDIGGGDGGGDGGGESYAVGTSYIGRTGMRQVHAGEMILNRQEVSRSRSASAGVQIGAVTLSLPNVTNQTSAAELMRQLMPEFQKLQTRYRKAA